MKLIRFLCSKVFAVQLLITAVLMLLLYWLVFGGIANYTRHNESVVVPDLRNMPLGEVGYILDSLDLRYKIIDSSEYNVDFERGAVVDVYPHQGLEVKPQRELLLTINPIVPEQVVLPDVIDKSKRQAMDKLRFAGLHIGTLTYVPDMANDVVLQMKSNGEEVMPGQKIQKMSTIDLVLGNGLSRKKTVMPYVVGMKLKEAAYHLKSFSLNSGAMNFDKNVQGKDSMEAFVYKQRPYASKTPIIRMGADVDLWLTMDSTKVKLDSLFIQNIN